MARNFEIYRGRFQNERNGSSVDHRTEKENQNGICACDEGHKSCISQINAIRSRVDLLEKEKRSLKKMCNEMRRASIDLTKVKSMNRRPHFKWNKVDFFIKTKEQDMGSNSTYIPK